MKKGDESAVKAVQRNNQGMILSAGNKFVTKKFFDFHKVGHV